MCARLLDVVGSYQIMARAEVYAERLCSSETSQTAAFGAQTQGTMPAQASSGGSTECLCPENLQWYRTDEQMDDAVDMLARGEWQAAAEVLGPAVEAYREAGSRREWDLADALWNLGYALSAGGYRETGAGCLQEAAELLVAQRRLRCWTRCMLALLAVQAERGSCELTPLARERLIEICKRLPLPEELARLAILYAELSLRSYVHDRASEGLRLLGVSTGISPAGLQHLCRMAQLPCDPRPRQALMRLLDAVVKRGGDGHIRQALSRLLVCQAVDLFRRDQNNASATCLRTAKALGLSDASVRRQLTELSNDPQCGVGASELLCALPQMACAAPTGQNDQGVAR
jgi:hypothetical protein